jgi:hypothetical protein
MVLAAMMLTSRAASAYPWMIRHQYQGCVPCHADPSGAGLLTEYGRAMGENVMRTRYGSPPPDEPPIYARFAFGVPLPEWLLLGGSFRNGVQFLKPGPGVPWSKTFLEMEADLKAQVTVSRFRAYGSLGYMHQLASPTQITTRNMDNLVSREHWLGVDLGDDKQFLLRAGRIDVPFGIRIDEHDMMVRNSAVTNTNINESQQHGVAFSYTGEKVRGEIMAILGNYQINPDAYRERGYSAFLEVNVAESKSVGVSSKVTYAALGNTPGFYQAPNIIRQFHGVFARLAPVEPLVLLIEADATIYTFGKNSTSTAGTSPGFVAMVQADVEPTQGLHLIASGETWILGNYVPDATSLPGTVANFGGWFGALWFLAPHADIRFDFVVESMPIAGPGIQYYLLPQFHVYL